MAKSQTKASAKYNAKAYEEIKLRVKTGQKEEIRQYAERKGYSLNGYINHLIESDMNGHQSDNQSGSKNNTTGADTLELSETVLIEQTDIEMLNLSLRCYNALKRENLNTVGDVTRYIEEGGNEAITKNIGNKNYNEYLSCIKNYKSKE